MIPAIASSQIPPTDRTRDPALFVELPPQVPAPLTEEGFVADIEHVVRRERVSGESFEADVINKYGRTLYSIFFEPYTRKFNFASPAELHQDWGRAGVNRAVIDKRAMVLLAAVPWDSAIPSTTVYYCVFTLGAAVVSLLPAAALLCASFAAAQTAPLDSLLAANGFVELLSIPSPRRLAIDLEDSVTRFEPGFFCRPRNAGISRTTLASARPLAACSIAAS